LVVPGFVIVITPAHMQVSMAVWSMIGLLLTNTVGTGGTQGAVSAGTHGIGVSTPSAAAVAAITTGLVGDMHMPNGGTLAIGLFWSNVAAGLFSYMTGWPSGITTSTEGAAPKLQSNWADIATGNGMRRV